MAYAYCLRSGEIGIGSVTPSRSAAFSYGIEPQLIKIISLVAIPNASYKSKMSVAEMTGFEEIWRFMQIVADFRDRLSYDRFSSVYKMSNMTYHR